MPELTPGTVITVYLDRGEAGIILNVLQMPAVRAAILGHTYGGDLLDKLITAIQTGIESNLE